MAEKITPISGFPEWLPSQRLVEIEVLDRIRRQAELYGFVPLETRAIEPLQWLIRHGETDKEIYTIGRLHDADVGERELGLHFDLTVPVARYTQEHRGRLDFPFKRYQIQKVWRGERPQEGRYREFYQADFDVIGDGELPLHFDAEMPLLMHELMAALPLPRITVLVSNRKILEGFGRGLGHRESAGIIRTLDKLDRLGASAVRDLLMTDEHLGEREVELWLRLASIRATDGTFVEEVGGLGVSDDLLTRGLDELAEVMAAAAHLPSGSVVADLHIARGLDYYTGTVYESLIEGHADLGSICSGGRYDDLAAESGGQPLPGVGVSIGISRLLGRFLGRGMLRASRPTPTCVLVALVSDDTRQLSADIARQLRQRGIATEVFHAPLRYGKQIRFADRRGIPFVWFPGVGDDKDSVRDLRSGDQLTADAATWSPPQEDRALTLLAAF